MAKKKKSDSKTKSNLAKVEELEDQLKRALADYANLQRRVEEQRSQVADLVRSTLVIKFLPILDSLEAALAAAKKEPSGLTRQGIEIAAAEFKKVLADLGVEEVSTEGGFNPIFHEAVEVTEGASDNKVAVVIQKGYRMADKILRPARVRVEKNPPTGGVEKGT